ncbi:hypothetical protein QTI66_13305 [Variovorax sp. J22R133]|uniref:hypothetical protein n=1 Tax=Variovorax brevis TaxID=3053503 RepID=UPI002578C523|nr:hypothetical protein [Variovorax sp. J22R133]MDM0113130.1 hypothetical protein [Variovorax sp. J22R133]
MLTTLQKANILRKAGVQVPAAPTSVSEDASNPAAELHKAAKEWATTVENLYVTYAAARAAKSLRDAEEARQLDMLRRLSSSSAFA